MVSVVTGDEEALRAQHYNLLAALLARPPSSGMLERLSGVEGDDTPLGFAWAALGLAARRADEASVAGEFQNLFIGLGRGELVPFGSYYLTGFLNEKPLAKLRVDMAALGIARADDVREPEDGIGSLCEMMAGLILGRFGNAADLSEQYRFFARHIEPWAEHFFADLESAGSADFYAPVGSIGRLFIGIEREAFRLAGARAQ